MRVHKNMRIKLILIILITMLSSLAFAEDVYTTKMILRATTRPAVAKANEANIYFDMVSQKLMISENEGFYKELLPITNITNLSTGATTNVSSSYLTSVYISTTLAIPNGNDPDVSALGQLSADTDDFALRGYDGTNQFVYGSKLKVISFTISSPLSLTEAATLPVWENRSGFTFNIVAIYSRSNIDDCDFTLKENNDLHDLTSLTTIEAITIATNGTSVYYDDRTTGIDHTVIENNHGIVFDADATDDPAYISVVIVGYYDANVD